MDKNIGKKILSASTATLKKVSIEKWANLSSTKVNKTLRVWNEFFLRRIFIGSYQQRRSQPRRHLETFLSHFFPGIEGKSLGAKFIATLRFQDKSFFFVKMHKNVMRLFHYYWSRNGPKLFWNAIFLDAVNWLNGKLFVEWHSPVLDGLDQLLSFALSTHSYQCAVN